MTKVDLLANELAKDTKSDDFQFETNIEFKADDIPGISNDQDPDDVELMNVDISDNLPDQPAKCVAPVCNVTRMKTKKKSS